MTRGLVVHQGSLSTLESALADPGIHADQDRVRKLGRRYAELAARVGIELVVMRRYVHTSPAVDLRQEPPLIAAGSGLVVSGGHCSAAGE